MRTRIPMPEEYVEVLRKHLLCFERDRIDGQLHFRIQKQSLQRILRGKEYASDL